MEFRDLVNTIDEKLSRNDDESSMELKDLVKILEGRLVGNDEYFSIDGLLTSKVSRNLAPFLGFPFDNRITEIVWLEPVFCTGDNLKKRLSLWVTL